MYIDDIDFPFLRILFECRVTGPLLYFTHRRGETIKGLIAHEMKKGFPCAANTPCKRCKFVDEPALCDYVRFFRFDITQSAFTYVIVPPLNPRSAYCRDEKFSFEIRLFGDCATFEYLIKYLAPAIEQSGLLTGMGNWYKEQGHFGRFQLSNIYTWQDNDWMNIFQEDKGFIRDSLSIQSFKQDLPLEKESYRRILFYTPFCLKRYKKDIAEPALEDISYFSLMRLRSIYCTREIRIDDDIYQNPETFKASTSKYQFEQSFAEKNLRYHIGNIEFEELPRDLLPLLKLGSFCHIGKGTTQGYGGFFLV